jgi:hypothetical protein
MLIFPFLNTALFPWPPCVTLLRKWVFLHLLLFSLKQRNMGHDQRGEEGREVNREWAGLLYFCV